MPSALTLTATVVSYAGLEPVMRLAESCDLHGIVAERLHVSTDKGSNAAGKVATIVADMLSHSIDDLGVFANSSPCRGRSWCDWPTARRCPARRRSRSSTWTPCCAGNICKGARGSKTDRAGRA